MKNSSFGNSRDLGNSFLHLPALPGGWELGMGGHHRSTGCCLWDAPDQPCREVGAGPAQALPGCSRGLWMLQGLPGVWVWGSLRGFCCCEDPGGSKGSGLLLRTHMSWRGVPRNLGCPQEPGCPQEFGCLRNLGCPQEPTVFPGVWGVRRSLGCSQGCSEGPGMLQEVQDFPQGPGSEHPRML